MRTSAMSSHVGRLPTFARRPEPHRYTCRLRARLLRLVQRPGRRRGDPLVPHVRRPGRRPFGRNRGRHLPARRDAFGAPAGIHGAPRAPVRLLHAGDAADGDRVPPRPSRRDGRQGDPRGDRRGHVPLHGYQQIVEAIQSVAAQAQTAIACSRVTIEQHPAAAKIASDTALKEGARRWLGKSINRVEDPRFSAVRAATSMTSSSNMAHAAIVRSPHAHARIVSIDTQKAEALPGVIRVVTGADVAEQAAPLPPSAQARSSRTSSPSRRCATTARRSRP